MNHMITKLKISLLLYKYGLLAHFKPMPISVTPEKIVGRVSP